MKENTVRKNDRLSSTISHCSIYKITHSFEHIFKDNLTYISKRILIVYESVCENLLREMKIRFGKTIVFRLRQSHCSIYKSTHTFELWERQLETHIKEQKIWYVWECVWEPLRNERKTVRKTTTIVYRLRQSHSIYKITHIWTF